LTYGDVVSVLDVAKGNGVERVGIVPPDPGSVGGGSR
jgi:biopolymer transport protein ExbD